MDNLNILLILISEIGKQLIVVIITVWKQCDNVNSCRGHSRQLPSTFYSLIARWCSLFSCVTDSFAVFLVHSHCCPSSLHGFCLQPAPVFLCRKTLNKLTALPAQHQTAGRHIWWLAGEHSGAFVRKISRYFPQELVCGGARMPFPVSASVQPTGLSVAVSILGSEVAISVLYLKKKKKRKNAVQKSTRAIYRKFIITLDE